MSSMLLQQRKRPEEGGANAGSPRPMTKVRPAESGEVIPLFLGRLQNAAPSSPRLLRKGNCGCGTCASCEAASKVHLSEESDPLEREADAVAERVMRSTASGGGASVAIQPPAATTGLGASAVSDGGRALDAATRAFMEPRFGAKLGSVRVHDGTEAAQSAAAFSARAFTVGEHVVFGAGEHRPQTEAGRHLIAHELAHVIQNRSLVQHGGRRLMRKSKFSQCTGTQPNEIEAAVVTAQAALNRGASAVANAYGRPDKVTAARRQLFMDHFHTMSHGDLRTILGVYVSIDGAFKSGLKFQCETKCPTTATTQTCGYAYNTQWFGGRGPISICFDAAGCNFTGSTPVDQTTLVIHEAAHRHAGIDDKAYRWDPAYSTLSAKQAMDNADSYAWFAALV